MRAERLRPLLAAVALAAAACAHAPSQAQLENGMHAVGPQLASCSGLGARPGTVQLDLIIVDKGTVGSAKVVGGLAHTPTGDCLEAAARSARFPRFYGNPIRFIWPVELR